MAALDELVIAGGQRRQEPATRPSHPPRGAMDLGRCPGVPRRRPPGLNACRRAGARVEPADHRPPMAAFEASFGGPTLFDRLPEGLRLNAAGEQLVAEAESVEDAVLRRWSGGAPRPRPC